eukprot:TRINITY_DN1760_c0_g3_i1.p2 TRINITY_DN1760_c0_g3~~TRINITY_DN1760_c0_g3_i1.p2  ORF type:complete len:100 (-),score=21.99 TRINITY_DN1760_c0_g3_i1:501-800(-)
MSITLQNLIEEQEKLSKELIQLENQIYEMETAYLNETANTGNVVVGFEGFLTNKGVKTQALLGGKRPKCNPRDRIFSLSSITSQAVTSLEDEIGFLSLR